MFSTRDVDHDRRSRRRERRQSACGVRARSGEKRGNGRGGAAEGRKGTHAQGRDHDVEDLAAVHAVLVREDLVQALGGVREGSGDVRAFRLGGVPGHGRDGADRVERRFLGGRVRSVRDRRRARGRLRGRRAREVDRRVVLRERGHQRRRRRLRLTRRAGHDRAASSGVTKRESRWCVGNDARRSTTLADRDCRLLVRPDAVLRVHSLLFSTSASAFAGNTRPFSLRDADGRAAFRAKPHTRARDDRESATGRSSRASRPLAPAPRLARAVARTWRPRRGTRRTSPPKTRATTAEPISRPRREAARAASRRTRARETRRRRRTRRRTRSLTKMTSPDRYAARLARRDTTRSRMRAARGCCFLFATFNAAFFPARCVSSRARARGASRRRASGNAARRGSTAALARTRRDLRGPSRRFARTSARSMPARAKTPERAPELRTRFSRAGR